MNGNVSEKQLKDLRNEFDHWSNITTSSVAFFALDNHVVNDFWASFINEDSMLAVRDKIEAMLLKRNKPASARDRADKYLTALRNLKAFLELKHPELVYNLTKDKAIPKEVLKQGVEMEIDKQEIIKPESKSSKIFKKYTTNIEKEPLKQKLRDVIADQLFYNYNDETENTHQTGLMRPMNIIKDDSARFAQQAVRDAFRAWLVTHHPKWSNGTVTMHYSDAYYLYNNRRGITLEEALTADNGLQKAYDVIEQFYTDNPTQTNNPSGSARGYLRSLRMLKEFIDENYPELLSANSVAISETSVPYAVVDVLTKNYSSGFRFETTYVNLLSSASGVAIDKSMQSALKRIMFRRDDDIYFLIDMVTDTATCKDIIDFADIYLQEYGCFEISEFYKLYEDKVNPNCIRNAVDFENFYKQIGKSSVRCVQAPYIGNRIARYSNGAVWSTFKEVATKIVSVIAEEYYGSCNEVDLHTKFCAFSTDLLGKIIRYCAADELIRVEINDSVCYQTFDALGLPENFSDELAEVLERLSDIGLDPTQDTLHATLSLKLGVNFKVEYNLPDWDAYRRLIAAFYKAEPRREWIYNIFKEATS